MTVPRAALLAGVAAAVAAIAFWAAPRPHSPAVVAVPCDSCTARHQRLTRAQETP